MEGAAPVGYRGEPDLTSLVEVEKAETLSKTQAIAIAINALLGFSAAGILYPESHDRRLGAWVAAVVALAVVRYALLCSLPIKRLLKLGAAATLKLAAFGALATGCVWAAVPILFINFDKVGSPFVSIILCGLTAGAAIQGRAYALPVVALSAPILLPLIVRLGLLGTSSGALLAFDTALFFAMILRMSREGEAVFSNLARLRWQAGALAADLAGQHAEAQAAADRFFRLASQDGLTGVASRGAFATTLEARIEAVRAGGGALLLMLLDLDHFKSINDTLGHGAGDEVLRQMGSRLASFRPESCFAARLGGDEFALLVTCDAEPAAQSSLPEALLRHVDDPFLTRRQRLNVGTSIGVACYPDDAHTGEELLARADLALYAAKDAGRSNWRRFEPGLLSAAEIARDVERDLPSALDAETLEVWFQPQVHIVGERLIGMEALLRWRHPQHGWIAPPDVVAAALKLRQSEGLTRHILNQACAMLRRLSAHGLDDVRIGVNISPREIAQYDIFGLVKDVLAAHGVDPKRLELEITEEAVLVDRDAIETLAALRALGVQLAVDDFGTGNSSLAYLRRLTIDRIKIDRIFVEGLTTQEGDRIVIKGVVVMSRSLGIEVIAEGVETPEQALILSSLGCNFAQGYLYGAALAPAEAAERLAREAAARAEPARPEFETPSGVQRAANA